MTTADPKDSKTALSAEDTEEMVKFGIIRVSVDYFHCGNFRYTNLKDAIAQAKRQRQST